MEGGSRTRRDGNEDGANKVCGGGCGERAGEEGGCAVGRRMFQYAFVNPVYMYAARSRWSEQTGGRSAPCRVSSTIHGCTRRVNTTCGAVPSRTTDVASRTTDVASPHCRQLLLKNIGLRDPT